MHKKKHSIYRVWYYPWFQAHAVGLEMHPLWIRKGNCTFCPQSRYNRAEIQMLGRTRQEMKKGEIGLMGILGKWRAPSLGRQRLLHRSKSTENKPSMARPASKTKLWNLKSLTEKKKNFQVQCVSASWVEPVDCQFANWSYWNYGLRRSYNTYMPILEI